MKRKKTVKRFKGDGIEPIYPKLGMLLKEHRIKAKVQQKELAYLLGVTRPTITNMEAGRQRIMLHQLSPLLKKLGKAAQKAFWEEING